MPLYCCLLVRVLKHTFKFSKIVDEDRNTQLLQEFGETHGSCLVICHLRPGAYQTNYSGI